MTKRTRTFLLIGMVILFVVLAPVVILYSLGYRFNIETGEITKTGALSLQTTQRGASIVVNGKESGISPKIFRSLVPRDYHAVLEREGFHTWEKTLTVEPQRVTEVRDILLPPLQVPLDIVVDEEFDHVSFSPSGEWVVGTKGSTLSRYRVEDGSLAETMTLPQPLALEEPFAWSPTERRLLVEQENSTLLVSFDASVPPVAILLTGLFWGPEQDNTLFRFTQSVREKGTLERINLTTLTAQAFPRKATGVAVTSNAFLVRVNDPTPHLEFWNSEGESLNIIILLEGDLGNPALQPAPESTRDILVLRDNTTGQAHIYDGRKEEWHDLGENVERVIPSENGRNVAIVTTDGRVWVYWLQKELSQPQREPGDIEAITRSSSLSSVEWMVNALPYLLTTQGNGVWMIELDGRNTRNRWKLLTLRSPTLHTFEGDDHIYIVSGGVVYKTKLE